MRYERSILEPTTFKNQCIYFYRNSIFGDIVNMVREWKWYKSGLLQVVILILILLGIGNIIELIVNVIRGL
jgi:hypothetical protein